MGRIFLPPRVSAELQTESRRREAAALEDLKLREEWREYNALLDRIVPGMRLAWCDETISIDACAQGAVPGRWHIVWPGYHGGPLNIRPLVLNERDEPCVGGDGPFVEPGSWMFDQLARMDMWSERAMREQRRIKDEAEQAKARRRERERREFDLEVLEHYKAVSRTQVSMNRDTAWSQNAAGQRAAKAAARERKEK